MKGNFYVQRYHKLRVSVEYCLPPIFWACGVGARAEAEQGVIYAKFQT
jgi:uncharacterized protein YcsI (UPF0317 family)